MRASWRLNVVLILRVSGYQEIFSLAGVTLRLSLCKSLLASICRIHCPVVTTAQGHSGWCQTQWSKKKPIIVRKRSILGLTVGCLTLGTSRIFSLPAVRSYFISFLSETFDILHWKTVLQISINKVIIFISLLFFESFCFIFVLRLWMFFFKNKYLVLCSLLVTHLTKYLHLRL